jgi:hypothetical protein
LLAIDLPGRLADTKDVTNAPKRERDEYGAPEISQRYRDWWRGVCGSISDAYLRTKDAASFIKAAKPVYHACREGDREHISLLYFASNEILQKKIDGLYRKPCPRCSLY